VAEMCRTYRGDMHKQTTNYVGAINNGWKDFINLIRIRLSLKVHGWDQGFKW
jgi:hypothetical protein